MAVCVITSPLQIAMIVMGKYILQATDGLCDNGDFSVLLCFVCLFVCLSVYFCGGVKLICAN